jgi:signal transduction histidine kinase/CheY-like chemotaxis protein/HPt (histidine-containing phosphotransfer) domain-containing protein/Tfp pilus assembly protein PilF
MKRLCILLFLIVPLTLHARKKGQLLIDSLLPELQRITEDTDKIKALYVISNTYASINPYQGIVYGLKDMELAEKTIWPKGLWLANNALGASYYGIADYQRAIEYNNTALEIAQREADKSAVAKILGDLSLAYMHQSNYPEALKNDTEALKINKTLGNNKEIAGDLLTIGLIYQSQSNYPTAMEYDLDALKMYEEQKDKGGIAKSFNNMGILYIDEQNLPDALDYFNRALQINEDRDDKSRIAENITNIGNVYISLHNYPNALEHYEKALKINTELNNKSEIARDIGNIGDVYMDEHNYPKALEQLLDALEINKSLGEKFRIANNLGDIGYVYLNIATDTNKLNSSTPTLMAANLAKAIDYLSSAISLDKEVGNLSDLQNFSRRLSEAQKLAGDYKGALESYTQYINARDSIFSIENNRKMEKLEEKKEIELNEKKIEVQRLQIAADKNWYYLLCALLAMLIIICIELFVRFRSVHQNKLQLEEKNKLIAAEKENADMLRLRAESSEQFKQQFLANMSHEIRTPMNAVSGMTDLLLERNPRPDQRNFLEVISKSSAILLHIINDILDLSKIEVGKMELETIDFSLTETINHVVDTLSFRAEEKGLQIITHIDGNVSDVVIGDSFRLNQVLLNLGGNAIKFTDKGSVAIEVHCLQLDETNISLKFAVSDTGIGIPADKQESLFESFRQVNTSDSRKYGGAGLGLSISKQLVELQGGRIWVESATGRGATFYFTIAYPLGSGERLQMRNVQEQKADGVVLNGLRILLADDNEYNRLVVVETLHSKAEVTIDQAVNGAEAIKMLEQNDYDVVLMDVQMPELNGFEATRHIRGKMSAPKNHIPVIALTANMLRFEIELIYSSGMNTYVPKPCKAWQLISAIAEQTGRKSKIPARSTKAVSANRYGGGAMQAPIADLHYLAKFCEGDEERMKKYIRVFMAAVPVFERKMNAALAEVDIAEITLQVHAFKPKWMMMGMKQCTELGQKIEALCRENNNAEKIAEQLTLLMKQNRDAVYELKDKAI